jgi:hypothetical protein
MVTKLDYPDDEVNVSLSVLVELITILGDFQNAIVIVGGWVPYFHFREAEPAHTGSLDIDLALDMQMISDENYRTILDLLTANGYAQSSAQPFIFYRTVKAEGGADVVVEVDLLAAEYGGTNASHRTQQIQDVKARKARGCDLVFADAIATRVRQRMPDGAVNEVTVRIAGVVPFMVMKGMALWSRRKEKDAYDIYFTLGQYRAGIGDLVDAFRSHLSNGLVREGLAKMMAKFQTMDSPGPVWAAAFLDVTDPEERTRIQRDAFELAKAFLDGVGIAPFEGV